MHTVLQIAFFLKQESYCTSCPRALFGAYGKYTLLILHVTKKRKTYQKDTTMYSAVARPASACLLSVMV